MVRLLIICLVLCPAALLADIVPVRSGEHATFTRLVLTLPAATTEWEMSSSENAPKLRITGEDLTFDISTVFERIPRTRLRALRIEPTGLIMELNCDCTTRAFKFAERSVVVDILDPVQQDPDLAGDARDPAIAEMAEITTLRVKDAVREDLQKAYTAFEPHFERRPDNDVMAAKLEAQLEQAIPQKKQSTATSEPSYPDVDGVGGSHDAETTETDPQSLPKNLELHTASGLDEMLKEDLQGLEARSQSHCIANQIVSLDDWANAGPALARVSGLRRSLMGEFDEIDTPSAIELARTYTFLTFGAEARDVLRLVPEDDEVKALKRLSHLMEGNPLPAQALFETQRGCSDWHTFWGVLSGARDTLTEPEIGLALRLLGGLPDHLRRELGPVLAERLVDADRANAAKQALAAVDRITIDPESATSLARAKVEIDQKEFTSAKEVLVSVLTDGSAASPQALTELVDLHFDQSLVPSEDLVSLVTAYAVEHRRTAYGPDLRRASALARVLSGDFDVGFAQVNEIKSRDGAEQAAMVRNELVSVLLQANDDFEVVRATVLHDLSSSLPPDLQFAMAERLLNAGFVDLAKNSMASGADIISPETRILRARLALENGLPKRAQAELLGLKGADVQALRARALALSGDVNEAASAYLDAGSNQDAERMAWLAGDWQTLAASADESYRKVARLRLSNSPESTDKTSKEEQVLARHQTLLAESVALRNLAGDLLAKHPVGDFKDLH